MSLKLLEWQQCVENFDGYLLSGSAVARCAADEVEDGISVQRVSSRSVAP